ncbi:hypothetical protein CPC08DRAFT_214765 [Agrocybe pediades]|nr:hypothetical protein CPC08DRAFT_214765 [Agrocybe pediades]
MTSKEPPKPAAILATPINVEESRAQRLQRQQSRFRDRGGIFVPSSRNTLADILLGKAPPIKKIRRSVSASPLKRKSLGNGAPEPENLTDIPISSKKTPAKQSRKSAGGSKVVESIDVEPKSKADRKGKSKESAEAPNDKTKSSGTRKTKSDAKPKRTSKDVSASTSKTKSAPTKAKSQKEVVKEPAAASSSQPVLDNPRSKTSRPSTTSSIPVASSSKFPQTSQTALPSKATKPTEVYNSKPPPAKRRKSYLYSSGGSEDEYVPKSRKATKTKGKGKQSATSATKDASSAKPNKSKSTTSSTLATKPDTRLPDIPEEDEEELSDYSNQRPRPNVTNSSTVSAYNKKTIEKEIRHPSPEWHAPVKHTTQTAVKSKPRPPPKNSKLQPEEDETSEKAAKKSSKQDVPPQKPPGKNAANTTSKKRSAQEAELEEEPLRPPSKSANKASSKSSVRFVDESDLQPTPGRNAPPSPPLKAPTKKAANTTSKKRSAQEAELEEPMEVVSKSAKKASAKAASSQDTRKHSTKRVRTPEVEESPVEDNHVECEVKRKKTKGAKAVSSRPEGEEKPKTVKSGKKGPATRSKGTTVREAHRSTTKLEKTAKRKGRDGPLSQPNTAKVEAVVKAVKRGPPKRVLQRLQDTQPHILDSEPDPIDFLS